MKVTLLLFFKGGVDNEKNLFNGAIEKFRKRQKLST